MCKVDCLCVRCLEYSSQRQLAFEGDRCWACNRVLNYLRLDYPLAVMKMWTLQLIVS